MAVRHSRAVQRLSSATRQAESRPGRIGPINLDVKQMGSAVREIRTLRSTRRGLETWHGRDGVTLADERERANGEHKLRPKPARQSSTLPMSGMWKRSHGRASEAPPNERGGNKICSAYRPRATSRLYHQHAFPPPRLSARCRISQRTVARTRGNGRDAPEAAVRRVKSNR